MGLRFITFSLALVVVFGADSQAPLNSPPKAQVQSNSIENVVKHFSPGKKDARCPDQNGGMPVFLRHETNCGQYYVCDTGQAIRMDCPHHLHFNKAKNVCDEPENAQCSGGLAQVVPEVPAVQPEVPVVQPVVPDASPGREDPRCPLRNLKYPVFLAHECECGRYYVCDTGLAILMRCPAHLHFNTRLNVCDQPHRAKCEIEELRRKVSSAPTSNSLPSALTGLYGVMLSPGKKDPRCPDKLGAVPVFLNHENDCGRYYVCDNGAVAVLMECPHRLHFNRTYNVCDKPERAQCQTKV